MDEKEIKEFVLGLNKARECHGKKIALLERDTEANSRWLKYIWGTIAIGFIASLAERFIFGV